MEVFTKETLIAKLFEIKNLGWVKNARTGNAGGVGNTLEDLLGIQENNLPLPNAAEWELKCQRLSTSSLTTLFHMEPSPRAIKFVPEMFLTKYGWKHDEAGGKYPANEMSFRQTISASVRTDRGFGLSVDYKDRKVVVSFDCAAVNERHSVWLQEVKHRIGLEEINPQPYWGFDDLIHKLGTKLHNCFYIQAEVKREKGEEFFKYCNAIMLRRISIDRFTKAIESGSVLVDFDARTGHNHGTKFRLRQNAFPQLYESVKTLF